MNIDAYIIIAALSGLAAVLGAVTFVRALNTIGSRYSIPERVVGHEPSPLLPPADDDDDDVTMDPGAILAGRTDETDADDDDEHPTVLWSAADWHAFREDMQ